jgi:hypothetical protein
MPAPFLLQQRNPRFFPPFRRRAPSVQSGGIILPNGDFLSGSAPPTLGSGVTVSGGVANCSSAGQIVTWSGVLTIGRSYRITLDYVCSSGINLRCNNSATNGAAVKDVVPVISDGASHTISFLIFTATSADLSIEADLLVFSGWIDNVVAVEDVAPILQDGDFLGYASQPTVGSGVTVAGGFANCSAASQIAFWTGALTIGQAYSISLDYNCTAGAKLRINNSATNGAAIIEVKSITADGVTRTLTFATFVASGADFSIEADTAVFSGWIDNAAATISSSIINVVITTVLALAPSQASSQSFGRAISAPIVVSAALSRLLSLQRSIAASLNLSASLASATTFQRSISAAIRLGSSIIEAATHAIRQSGLVSLGNNQSRTASHPRAISASSMLFGSQSRILAAQRQISGFVTASAFISAIKTRSQTFFASISLFGSSARILSAPRTISGSIAISGSLTKIMTAPRQISGRLATSASISAIKVRLQSISGFITAAGSIAAQFSLHRTIAAQLVLAGTISKIEALGRIISGQMALSASLARSVAAQRLIAGRLIVSGSVGRLLALSRAIGGIVGLGVDITAASSSRTLLIAARISLVANVTKSRGMTIAARIATFGQAIAFRLPTPQRIIRFVAKRIGGGWGFRSDRRTKF